MNDDKTINAYHGTDYEVCLKIKNEGFKFRSSNTHWLGNGVYFFEDIELAKWWSEKPSKHYGSETQDPGVIIARLSYKSVDEICDLRKLNTYNECLILWDKFQETLEYAVGNEHTIDLQQIRCAYFDWIQAHCHVKITIAPFIKRKYDDVPYVCHEDRWNQFCDMLLPYVELQICVYDTSCITVERVVKTYEI